MPRSLQFEQVGKKCAEDAASQGTATGPEIFRRARFDHLTS